MDALKTAYLDARDAFNAAAAGAAGAGSAEVAALEKIYKSAKKAYKRAKKGSAGKESGGAQAEEKEEEEEEEEVQSSAQKSPAAAAEVAADAAPAAKKRRKRKRKKKGGASEEAGGTPIGAPTDAVPASDGVRQFKSMGNKLEAAERTAFVGGISYDANEDDLREFFSDCGTLTSVRVPRYQDSGKPRGYAHIEFSTDEGLRTAMAKNKQRMMGRYLDIKVANRRRTGGDFDVSERPAGCRTVFVKNLPYDTKDAEVFASFQFCGKIAEVRLVRWGHTNKLKGIGYVQFEKEESAVIAVKKRGEIRVGGRSVQIDFEGGAPKASYRDAEGSAWKKNSFSKNKRPRKGPSF
jgi:nucleolin